jgi:hypothetical protein
MENIASTALAVGTVSATSIETAVKDVRLRGVAVPKLCFLVSSFRLPVSIFQFLFSSFFSLIIQCPQS